MAFSMISALATPAVNATTSTVNTHGLYTLAVTLENLSVNDDFLLAAIRKYAIANSVTLKEDIRNSYVNFYLVPALEVGVGALEKSLANSSANAVNMRVPLAALTQSQAGSALYKSFSIAGLPAGYQYKWGFELVINGVAEADWIADTVAITLNGTTVAPPDVTLVVAEIGNAVTITIDTADISSTANFVLEVVDSTKAAMPELSYDESVVSTSAFAWSAESKPVFTFSPTTPNMQKYIKYDIRIRARVESDGIPDATSDSVIATAQPFELPWLTDFVDQTVIKGKQIEDSLVTDLAQSFIDSPASTTELRKALNTGSYSTVATLMYDLARKVAVTEFSTMGSKFTAVREQLRRIALYSAIDAEYGELIDLTDVETNDAFTFVTKQGFSGTKPTSYYSWLDKAFHLGAVVEGSAIAADKYYVTIRGSVYRDRAEILFS
jgi:hypothetical protein